MGANAARQETGLAPKVGACGPASQSMISAQHHDAQRHAGLDALGNGHDVRNDPEMFQSKHLASSSHARPHSVGHVKNAVFFCKITQLQVKLGRGHDIAAFALNGFDKDGGDLFRRDRDAEKQVFDPARQFERGLHRVGAGIAKKDLTVTFPGISFASFSVSAI